MMLNYIEKLAIIGHSLTYPLDLKWRRRPCEFQVYVSPTSNKNKKYLHKWCNSIVTQCIFKFFIVTILVKRSYGIIPSN